MSVENQMRARTHALAALEQLKRAVRLDPDTYQAAHDSVRDALDESKIKQAADEAAGGRWSQG